MTVYKQESMKIKEPLALVNQPFKKLGSTQLINQTLCPSVNQPFK